MTFVFGLGHIYSAFPGKLPEPLWLSKVWSICPPADLLQTSLQNSLVRFANHGMISS